MKLSRPIKPISFLKAHAAEIVRNMKGQVEPRIVTQNSEAKVVLQDIASYEQTQETLAFLKILALGKRQIEKRRVEPASEVIGRLRNTRTGQNRKNAEQPVGNSRARSLSPRPAGRR